VGADFDLDVRESSRGSGWSRGLRLGLYCRKEEPCVSIPVPVICEVICLGRGGPVDFSGPSSGQVDFPGGCDRPEVGTELFGGFGGC